MKFGCRHALGLSLLIIAPLTATAEIRLPHIFSDHAVLQREAPIHIWGWSDPKERITAHFHAQTRSADANQYGEWSLWLMPEHPGGPYTLTVSGSSATGAGSGAVTTQVAEQPTVITISDLLVGDVWFASGQSNMEIPLSGFPGSAVIKNADQEIARADQPQLRLLMVDHAASDVPLNDNRGTWTLCTPETAAKFSAVAYFFGREISNREHVPIGLIDSTWGGTPVESWISLDGLSADASLMPAFAVRARFADEQSRVPAVAAEEKREDDAARAAGQPIPKHPWHPMQISWEPASLFNGMIAPFATYSMKGVIWYQGETNSSPERAPQYVRLFPALIEDWREKWKQGNFPFLYVQISSFNSPPEIWGTIRDAQRRTLAVANTAMTVSIDVGEAENVHPPDKQTVAARLAVAARKLAYNEPVEYSGPLFRQATTETTPAGASIRVWFDHAAGLTAKGPQLLGFEVAGEDKQFSAATAAIDGSSVVVTAPVKDPVYVRYGWANVSDGNLYNDSGLPASTFTSEETQ